MIFVKFFILFGIFILKFYEIKSSENLSILNENEFFIRLENLIEFCIFGLQNDAKESREDSQGILLGVLIAKGQLRNFKFKSLKVQKIYEQLEFLEKELRKKNKVHRKFLTDSPQNHIFDVNFPISYGNLKQEISPNFYTSKNYLQAINDEFNQPDGFNSDLCIDEIFENDCKVSEECEILEDVRKNSFGYQQTHKLLFHIFNHLACLNQTFSKISSQLCSKIYHEASFVDAKLINSVVESRDLFMEQILLCVSSGFGEFLRNDWIRDILSWQMNNGCFSFDEINCSNHMNGLGIALLTTLGKIYENI